MFIVGNFLTFDAAPVVQEISISPYIEGAKVAFATKPVISINI